MTSSTTFHIPWHRLTVSRATLRLGWPRKLAAVFMIIVGLSFVVTTLIANLFSVGRSFDRLTDGFRPIMTQQALRTDRADIASLSSAGTEIRTTLIPALATQLHMTPAQMSQMMTTQYPAVGKGLQSLPAITANFNGLVTKLDNQRTLFASADAIPTKSVPAAVVPWALLAVGAMTVALGVLVWFTPRASAVLATVVGAALVAMPLALGMTGKASDADQLNANLKPVYTQALITQASSALATLGAMGNQMQTAMLPALAAQLHLQPAELQAMLAQNFPATAKALRTMPSAMARFGALVTTFKQHLADYNTMKPVSFEPIVITMLVGGGVLFCLGSAGIVITRRGKSATR